VKLFNVKRKRKISTQ